MSGYRNLVDYVNKRLIGRVALNGDDQAELLCQVTAVPGLHLEVGCLWGGTAILAALAKREAHAPGHILSIDFMLGGFWDTEDPEINKRPHPQDVYMNAIRFGVEGMISVLRCSSYPWPFSEHLKPATALIDGDHSYNGCKRDWESLKDITEKTLIFHDYHPYYPGVQRVVDELVKPDPAWEATHHVGRMIVFERNNAVSIGHPADIQQAAVVA